METIFTVSNGDLSRLDPQSAVKFFSELLWAEARRINIPTSDINISENVYIPDGGVDASVNSSEELPTSNLIVTSKITFQLKSGDFKPYQKSIIRKELFGKSTPSKENLNIGIKNILDIDGTYIIVCTGIDLIESQLQKSIQHIEEFLLNNCRYTNPKIKVWSQNTFKGFLKLFPSLSLQLNGRATSKFQTYESWAKDEDMMKEYISGEIQTNQIISIQEELRREKKEATHIRIIGEPGIGKTRLVFEATNTPDLSGLVIYSNASIFRDSDLMNEILRDDNSFSTILIIDECNSDSRSYIWNKLKNRGSRIKLITIYNEEDETSGNSILMEPKPLSNSEISEIIQNYKIPKDIADRYAQICSGSPRVAHVIGLNFRINPDDLLKSPDNLNIWKRYLTGGDMFDSEEVKQIEFVLTQLSLFKKFGYGDGSQDFNIISSAIIKGYPTITSDRLKEIIKKLRRRKILQGEYILYITPKLLHIWLWVKWWDTYKIDFNFEKFSKEFESNLLSEFYKMFEYAANSSAAMNVVKELLGENGLFQDDTFLRTKLGADFFFTLIKVAPEEALKRLKKIIDNKSKDDLFNFTTGRREIIWSLEYTGQFKNMFKDSIMILLRLAESENEKWANNATGIFSEFFSLGTGQLASTEMPPIERLNIIKEYINSPKKEIRRLILKAIDSSLSEKMTRTIGLEGHAFTKKPNRWNPKTYKEIFDSLIFSWRLLIDNYEFFNKDEKEEVLRILTDNLYNIAKYEKLGKLAIKDLTELSNKKDVNKKILIIGITRTLNWHKKDCPPEYSILWSSFLDSLTGNDFKSKLKRYVGMQLFEDEYDENGERTKNVDFKIDELSDFVLNDKNLLNEEFNWLMTKEAENGYKFGYSLGLKDLKFLMLDDLIGEQKKITNDPSLFFLGGYFRALAEINNNKYENIIKKLSKDNLTINWVPEIIWRSGLNDNLAMELIHYLRTDQLELNQFYRFKYGTEIEKLSENIFIEFVKAIIDKKNYFADSLALDLCHFYYVRNNNTRKKIPKTLILKIILKTIKIEGKYIEKRDQMDSHNWKELAKLFISNFPEEKLLIANKLIESFKMEGSITDYSFSGAQNILFDILADKPSEVWDLLQRNIGPPIDLKAYELTRWLRNSAEFSNSNSNPALELIPIEILIKWINEDIVKRAYYVASFVPNRLFREEGRVCYAREILVHFGEREDVKSNLIANFNTEGWTGPGSLHYQSKKDQLIEFKKFEENTNVLNWIDEYISNIEFHVKREKIEEERQGF